MLTQATTRESDVPLATATLLFIQTLGGAFGVSAAQAAFQNTLLTRLPITAPSVDPFTILNAGATELRSVVAPEALTGVLEAYVDAFRETLVVAIAFGGAAFLSAFGFRWKTIDEIRKVEGQA
jgi:MFS transporter, DHA2 family, glioxin efflux transporter